MVSKYGDADGYIVIYSVADRETFDDAVDVLYEIRKEESRKLLSVILVANKEDMVRNRIVNSEGKTLLLFWISSLIQPCLILVQLQWDIIEPFLNNDIILTAVGVTLKREGISLSS